MKLIDKILEDFSILEDVNASEVDDFQNPIHIVRLKEVMASYGIQDEVINTIINKNNFTRVFNRVLPKLGCLLYLSCIVFELI